ncbi:MAG: AraC family transcriptional regulator [Alteromonadaceae bacterium]|nr:AraC family transcriptional regulator [Alteromonadaceae bacterium]
MEPLNLVNLIQAATVGVSSLGGVLLWQKSHLRGIALLVWFTAFASAVNILEETGITRDIYLISPVFIMFFGPAVYLAVKHATHSNFKASDWLHLLPVLPILFFTAEVAAVIAVGTVWRVIYAYFTARLLIHYKQKLDEQRSDADDFSLNWLLWLIVVTALFNFVDLVRLNSQILISHELNIFGQGINNGVWLLATSIIIVKFVDQNMLPRPVKNVSVQVKQHSPGNEDYQSIFNELDRRIQKEKWFLQLRLTLADISELTGLQTREISRAINTVTHKSFNEYINDYRVQHVCQALDKQTSMSLTQLYTDAGFSSKASFNKVFKENMGVTPSQYKSDKSTGS